MISQELIMGRECIASWFLGNLILPYFSPKLDLSGSMYVCLFDLYGQ